MKLKPILTCCLFLFAATIMGQTILTIDGSQKGPQINSSLYGLFFEEINHAGDGGIYAELIRNRSFEDNSNIPEGWRSLGSAQTSLFTKGLLNKVQGEALHVNISSGTNMKFLSGISNEGFWGINAVKGRTYTLNLWMQSPKGYHGKIAASLQSADGTKIYARTIFSSIGKSWKKYTATITSNSNDSATHFSLLFDHPGTVDIDMVSLFPPTFKNHKNGLRPDLAQMLYDVHPGFIRFPGGCYVEGVGSYENAFQWRRTIGPIEQRPGHWNKVWGYRSSDGLGFDEYLQMCEDLRAAPLFVVNIGLGHEYSIPIDSLQPYIKDVLDALEYANGDIHTPMGALRAKNGHSQPYNIKYIELGNENYQAGNDARSQEYPQRYNLFRKSILSRFPQIKIIGNVEAWGTDSPSWRNNYPVDFLDEHYYRSYSWMRQNFTKYDHYARKHQIYNGEYAANESGSYGKNGTIQSALGEAIYMLGMERNADICTMASFAPIFTHENNRAWDYDMIHFTAAESFATPSYYVQKLFAHNLGRQALQITETNNTAAPPTNLRTGLGTWKTAAQFESFAIIDPNDNFIAKDNYANGLTHWIPEHGKWQKGSLNYIQNSQDENCVSIFNQPISQTAYEINVNAKKISGDEGFLLIFNYQDDKNYCWWNIGGWGNTKSVLESCINGSKTSSDQRPFTVKEGETYQLRLLVNGNEISGFINGQEMLHTSLPSLRAIYSAAALNEKGDTLILKIVNPDPQINNVHLNFKNLQPTNGTLQQLKGLTASDENTLAQKQYVVPSKQMPLSDINEQMTFIAPPFSLNILKLKVTP
jgi:alpha-L-arabinofuranosidase